MKSLNLFSENAQDFLPNDDYENGGWEVHSGSADLRTYKGRGLYPKYIPVGSTLSVDPSSSVGSLLIVRSNATNSITIESEFVEVNANTPYLWSAVVGAGTPDRIAKMTVEYYTTTDSSSILPRDNDNNKVQSTSAFGNSVFKLLSNLNIAPEGATFAKLFVTYTDDADTGTITATESFLLYDPVVVSVADTDVSPMGYATYLSIPEFMRYDDENIESLASDLQPQTPLMKFIDILCTRLSMINETVYSFRYDRAVDGEEYLSKLTDPYTTDADNLLWLASVVGVDLYSQSVGSTPWLALELTENNLTPPSGQWDDLADYENWIELQSSNPEFFDIVNSYRNQIATGFTGIHAGRPDTIVSYMKTALLYEQTENPFVDLIPRSRDNAFRVTLLVDELGDPDPQGSFLTDILQLGLPAGTTGEKSNLLHETSDLFYDFDILYTSLSLPTAAGVKEIVSSMISDSTGHGANLLLNDQNAGLPPELGGEIGTSEYFLGTAYYSGQRTYFESEEHSALDLSRDPESTGYEIVIELSSIFEDYASAVSESAISLGSGPPNWLYRRKQLIARGAGPVSSGRISNDWALYLVSGSTLDADQEVRLLWIDGYTDINLENWAVSDPIELAALSSSATAVIRVRYDGENINFYAQKGFFGNWGCGACGFISSSSFIPNMQQSPTGKGRVIFGSSLDLGTWADADPISAGYRSFMLWKSPIKFSGEDTTSSDPHAIVNGVGMVDYGVYTYVPNAHIPFWNQNPYSDEISFQVDDVSPQFITGDPVPSADVFDGGGIGGGGVFAELGY